MNSKFPGLDQSSPQSPLSPGGNGSQQFPFDPEQIRKKIRLTMVAVLAIVILFVGLTGLLVFAPNLFAGLLENFDSGPIKGSMLDLTYVPDGPFNGKVWIVTNPSFNYVQTVSSPGSYSVSSECLGCKLRVYIYDPLTAVVQNQWDIPLKAMPVDVDLYYQGDSVWMTARETDQSDPLLYQYNAQSGAGILNAGSFVRKFPELTAPVVELSQFTSPERYNLKLSDGKEFIFTPDDQRLFAGQQAYDQSRKAAAENTVFALVDESSSQRKKLFSITGPGSEVTVGRCDHYAGNADSLEFFCQATARQITEEIFLEPLLVYQDGQLAVLIHQDNLGRDAKRYLSAYTRDGKKLWSLPQEKLFYEIKYDPADSFSEIFFIGKDLSMERSGKVLIFIVNGVGAIGLNAETGAELWRIKT